MKKIEILQKVLSGPLQALSGYFSFSAFRQQIKRIKPDYDLVAVLVPEESRMEVAEEIKKLLVSMEIEGFVMREPKKKDSSVGDVIKDPAAAPSPGLESHLDNNEGTK